MLSAGWYWHTDAQLRLTHVFGRCGHADLRRRPWELTGVDMRHEGWSRLLDAMLARRPFENVDWRRLDARGLLHQCVLSGEPVFGTRGHFRGYRGVGRDVTGALETAQALNASESQLASIIDSAMDAIITIDAQHRVLVFNQAASALFDCPRSEALGLPLAHFVPGGLAAILSAGGTDGPQSWSQVRAGQVVASRRGEPLLVEASVSRMRQQPQEMFSVVLRDLTDRLAWEKARATLECQLRESQKMEALGTLAGGIAHDFNNIVAAILGNVALARTRMAPDAAAQVFVDEIGKAAFRARDLVQRILAFSRRQPAVYRCQPLQPLVQETAQLLRATLPSGVQLVLSLAPEPLHVRADGAQVAQVLMNLGTNAWQALQGGHGTVTITLERHGALEARLSVADNGRGMDEATLARIFEPFFTTKPMGTGTGLGLPVVHGVVTGHGGRIAVSSRPGVGTVFEVFLPLSTPEAGTALLPAPDKPARGASGAGRHVVYVDDYPAIVFMVRSLLESQGFRVTAFEDVEAALIFMRHHGQEVDLFVTDYNMPGRSGLEVAQLVLREWPQLPVVLASGYITDALRSEAAAIGVARLFDKPDGVECLSALVHELLPARAPSMEAAR